MSATDDQVKQSLEKLSIRIEALQIELNQALNAKLEVISANIGLNKKLVELQLKLDELQKPKEGLKHEA